MGHQVTGFWINYQHLHEWWMAHDLSIPWKGTEGTIAVGLYRYLAANAGLTSRLGNMNLRVKVDYLDIELMSRPNNQSPEPEVFLPRRYKAGLAPEVIRETDRAFASKLRHVGLTKFVLAVLKVDDKDGRIERSDHVLYDSESDPDSDHSNDGSPSL